MLVDSSLKEGGWLFDFVSEDVLNGGGETETSQNDLFLNHFLVGGHVVVGQWLVLMGIYQNVN